MKELKKIATKKMLQTKDKDKQITIIEKMSKKLSTSKLKKGYRRLKNSNKPSDIHACIVIKNELKNRGVKL